MLTREVKLSIPPDSGVGSSSERWIVLPENEGERLDRHIAERLHAPRNQVARWIAEGQVEVGDRVVHRVARRVHQGEHLCCRPVEICQEGRVLPREGELNILFEDPEVVVLDKPAGTLVHPGAGQEEPTLANFLLHRYPEMAAVGGPGRPGIVHRLDRGTTGVLLVARSASAYLSLSRAFTERAVVKRYLVLVYGRPRPALARIVGAIGRHTRERTKMVLRPDGRPAATSYRILASERRISLLEIDLGTGRTHQIRVHLKACHHPVVGDPLYGEARWKELARRHQEPARSFPRPALHAWRLAFPHPATGATRHVEAPLPEDLAQLWTRLTATDWPRLPEGWEWPDAEIPERNLL